MRGFSNSEDHNPRLSYEVEKRADDDRPVIGGRLSRESGGWRRYGGRESGRRWSRILDLSRELHSHENLLERETDGEEKIETEQIKPYETKGETRITRERGKPSRGSQRMPEIET